MTKISSTTIKKKPIPIIDDTVFGGDSEKGGEMVRYDMEVLAALINGFNNSENSIYLQKTTGEAIPSHTPIAIVDNLAYKLDASNPLHQFAFVGFSTNGTSIGQNCLIKENGEIELFGWGLIPNTQYLASANGAIVSENISEVNFTKIVGYARTANILEIITDYPTVNK